MASRDTAQSEEDRERRHKLDLEEALAQNYWKRVQKGDKLALMDCVVICAVENIVIPRWARHELARVFLRYLYGTSDNLDDALFGAKKSPGRHSKAVTKRRKDAQHQLWFDIVTALKEDGFRGRQLWERALELIKQSYAVPFGQGVRFSLPKGVKPPPTPDVETLKKTYYKLREKGTKPSAIRIAFKRLDKIWLPTPRRNWGRNPRI